MSDVGVETTRSSEVMAHEPSSERVGCLQHIKDFRDGFRMTPGDWGSLTQLFFDNLSTLLGVLFAIQAMTNFGVDPDQIDTLIFSKIVPGVGITLLVGNAYYTWMGIRLTKKWGRPYTAQPYGLNTAGAFAIVFNIMYPVYFSQVGAVGPAEAFETGYKVCLAANFITGLISVALAFFGPLILKLVPPAALLVPISGIGIAFLGLEQAAFSIAAPIVGYSAIVWVFIGWYAMVRVGYKSFRCPEALQVIIVGTALGWITGLNQGSTVQRAASFVKWYGPDWSADELFADFDLVKDYLGIVIPIAIAATASTLMCLVSAKNAGDPYPVRESMIADGIGTMIASFFGSPVGTVIYIGHPAHKRSGALVGYSLTNGCIYFVLSWFGVLALVQSVVNQATIGPIVLFVGLMINEEAINFMPPRHYAAYIIGLFPSLYDWTVNVAARSPLTDDFENNNNLGDVSINWFGVLAWKRGAILVSMIWVSICVFIIDRRWKSATIWALIGALFALPAIIHGPEAGFKNWDTPLWDQCDATRGCWDFAEQWMFFVGYLLIAATFVLIEIGRKWDKTFLPAIEDETTHAFDDWFANAAIVTEPRSDPVHGDIVHHLEDMPVEKKMMMVDEDDPDPTTRTSAEPDDEVEDMEA